MEDADDIENVQPKRKRGKSKIYEQYCSFKDFVTADRALKDVFDEQKWRKGNIKNHVHVQPVETQNNLEVEDDEDEDSFIIEFDEEQDSIMTINNQETIDTLIIQAEPISISNADNQILTQLEHQNIVLETNVDKSTTAKRPRGRPPKNKATANKKPRT